MRPARMVTRPSASEGPSGAHAKAGLYNGPARMVTRPSASEGPSGAHAESGPV